MGRLYSGYVIICWHLTWCYFHNHRFILQAFSGAVVEKSVITSENKGQTSAESSAQTPRTKQTDTQTTEQSNSQTQRPVSRFKAQRMAKK